VAPDPSSEVPGLAADGGDASLFPDSLEINPYVAVMALADRTAQAVRADAGELLGGRVELTTA